MNGSVLSNLASAIIEFNGVGKTYPTGEHAALTSVDLLIQQGSFTALIGPSGCGKSTAIKLIAGLEGATSGTVVRPDTVAVVFQSGALLPWLTAAQNMELVLKERSLTPSQIKRKTRIYLEMVGLDELADKHPRLLSGGQRQRVGLARALAVEPQVLVLDEPFAALDIRTTDQLHQDLLKIWRDFDQTVVMVSHSIDEAVTLADRIILMNNGKIARSYDLTDMPRPRREQAHTFIEQVHAIRSDFIGLGD